MTEPRMCECPRCGKWHAHLRAGKPPYVSDEGDICQCPECGRMHKKPRGDRQMTRRPLPLPHPKQRLQFVHVTDRDLAEEGISYLHCQKCLEEKPDDISPRDWARLSVMTTKYGIQVWCVRHTLNVDHIVVFGPSERIKGIPLVNDCGHEHEDDDGSN